MTFGPIKVFQAPLASAATFSSIDTFSDGVQAAYLEIPTMTSGADFYLQGSTDGTTFRRIMQPIVASSTIQINTFTIGSAATNKIIPIPLAAPYMRVELSTAPVTAMTFNFICVY